jgi:nucleoside-diphosphate-sugar epimerase
MEVDESVAEGRYKRILIVGAAGRTGKLLTPVALAHGHTVTALLRDESRLTLVHDRLIKVVGSVRDPEIVAVAMQDQDVVVSMLANRVPGEVTIFSKGTQTLLDAAEAAGVKRFITVSAMPVGVDPKEMPIAGRIALIVPDLSASLADMELMEQDVMSRTGLDWTIVRPGVLSDEFCKTVQIEVGEMVAGGVTTSRFNLSALLMKLAETDLFVGDRIAIAD